MSKINVDEIQVGDLIQRYSEVEEKYVLAVVTNITTTDDVVKKVYGLWSNDYPKRELWTHTWNLTGHWKVINFEEETKMDELKVYTGKDTIEALLEGKVLQNGTATQYKLDKGKLMADYKDNKGFVESLLLFNSLIIFKLTEVVTPQVGDWVRVTTPHCNYVGELSDVDGEWLRAKWNDNQIVYGIRLVASKDTLDILSPEQVSEYKREQAFVKVGRKLNEFKPDDIVYVESLGEMAVVVSNMNDQEVRLHKVNIRAGLTAKPHQLTPISFIEQQVDLS